jgi:hypothetical protein
MIATHNGPWGDEGFRPDTKEEWAVHLADYIASRSKVVMRPFKGEDFFFGISQW